jgi:hypothetical protein
VDVSGQARRVRRQAPVTPGHPAASSSHPLYEKGETSMKVKVLNSILTTMAVVCFTGSMAFAGFPGHHHSSQKSMSMDILQTTQVPDGPTLEPGTYTATFVEDSSKPEVEFYQQGKLVGQAPVTLVDEGKKIKQTEFQSNQQANGTNVLTEMDFSGLTQKLVFKASGG